MSVRVLDGKAVESLLTPTLALDAMRDLFSLDDATSGYSRTEIRHQMGWLRALPGYITPLDVFGLKTIHYTQDVGARYVIYVFDLETGGLVGLVDGSEETNLRTGAVSALATDLMAAQTVDIAAIVGTGTIARGQVEVLDLVRPASEVRVFSRNPENRKRFMEEMTPRLTSPLVEAASLEEAVDGADLVTLATKAVEPIFYEHHLRPGMHVNSVGPAHRGRSEVDPAAFAAFDQIVCDSVGLVTDEAGDAHQAVIAGYLNPATALELASVVAGAASGRSSREEVTLFKSVGTGLQDLIVASRLLEAAELAGVGQTIDDFVTLKLSR
jgi:alanine dehydrogenase